MLHTVVIGLLSPLGGRRGQWLARAPRSGMIRAAIFRFHRVRPGLPHMHPCLSCGACCATFRVSIHWSETEPDLGGSVPAALTEKIDAHRVAMRGTWEQHPRCVALDADIGRFSRCTIHPMRPSVCREVDASWEHGAISAQCDKARTVHGLPVLTQGDWPAQG
jgi:Fe-S-cluster containining protein